MNNSIAPTNTSLSTMWAIHNFQNLNDFFNVSRQMGFLKVELNHQVDTRMLEGVNWDNVQVSSLHEPCPAGISTKELARRDWLISSQDEPSRCRGVDEIKKSILLARQLGAPVVVIHCGNVSADMRIENELRSLFKAGKDQSSEYKHQKSQLLHLRESQVEPRLQAVKKSLQELLEFSHSHQIKLGLENRYHYTDIPSIDEMGDLLNLADENELGFIYDVGHARALDRLGFYPQEEWLVRYSKRILGTHLHDVIGVTDHYAPGLGEIDFKAVAGYLPETAFRTCEILPGNSRAQVENGLQILVSAGCVKIL